MKTYSTCCGGTTSPCDSHIAELPRYYPRQLITPDDLTLEQNYFRDRMRRHNRLLHGWGVVCGGLVCPVTIKDSNGVISVSPWQVQVNPGYILGPYGDEIILDCTRTVDLRTTGVSGVTGDPCIDVPDPWCSQVTVPRTTGPLYVAIKYKQSMTRPVRVQPVGCGCDDSACECSRWHDGYEIGILTCCPDTAKPPEVNLEKLFKGDVPLCPDCPPQPWVVLASVQVDSDGAIGPIDNCACRRLVASLSGFWWQCSQGDTKITSVTLTDGTPAVLLAGKKTTVFVHGANLDPKATYTFGNGILVGTSTTTPPSDGVALDLTPDASISGSYTLVVINTDCRTVTSAGAITVQPAPSDKGLKNIIPPQRKIAPTRPKRPSEQPVEKP